VRTGERPCERRRARGAPDRQLGGLGLSHAREAHVQGAGLADRLAGLDGLAEAGGLPHRLVGELPALSRGDRPRVGGARLGGDPEVGPPASPSAASTPAGRRAGVPALAGDGDRLVQRALDEAAGDGDPDRGFGVLEEGADFATCVLPRRVPAEADATASGWRDNADRTTSSAVRGVAHAAARPEAEPQRERHPAGCGDQGVHLGSGELGTSR
jgi:hypothetical protein